MGAQNFLVKEGHRYQARQVNLTNVNLISILIV
jgi:hypothetical protein